MSENSCTGETCSVQSQSSINSQLPNSKSQDKEGSDDFYNELIAPEYGSNQSPEFNNTEDMNPNESNYGYEGAY